MAGMRNSDRIVITRQQRLFLVICIDLILLIAVLVTGGMLFARKYREKNRPDLSMIKAPDWYTQDFFDINEYSRSGKKRSTVNNIVVHYVANKNTRARNNWTYFNNLGSREDDDKKSAHYIIGLDGEILQGIPLDEIAYANYPRNEDTVSIECCHPDDTGEFTPKTKEALIKLTAWLCNELKLTEKDVIRHYDVIGKNCPKYYVEHEDAWKELLKEIKKKRKES